LAGLGRTLARPSHARESQVFGSPPAPQRPGPTRMTAPSGCRSKLESKYHRLCDLAEGWGIALETLAGVGAVATVAFMFALLILISKVQDANRRKMLPTQFLFLLGVFGVFGLTFAFLIKLDGATGPTRFFLFGVLFAICFSCLLAHTFNLNKLVRGRKPLSWLVILSLALGFSLVQDVIAIEYLVLTMNRTNTEVFSELPTSRRNEDFVMLLIYVLFLMALTFFSSFFVFCGSFPGWKRHGAHICCTSFLSIAVWVAWIVLLLIPDIGSEWDDTILCTALVANGWVFLAFYVFPEFLRLPRQQSPTDYPVEDAFCKPQLMKQSYGVENRAYSQEEITQGLEDTGDTLYVPYSTHFQMQKDFSIPRAHAPTSPYNDYKGRKGDS
ncbi:Retinoic acid-induced protein 3, partial [Lemmus lemmus]